LTRKQPDVIFNPSNNRLTGEQRQTGNFSERHPSLCLHTQRFVSLAGGDFS